MPTRTRAIYFYEVQRLSQLLKPAAGDWLCFVLGSINARPCSSRKGAARAQVAK